MMNTSINISEKIEDFIVVEFLSTIKDVASELNIPFFVVGAMARDLILWYGHQIETGRATSDIDLGVRVSSWDEFNKFKDSLIQSKLFKAHGNKCRLKFKDNLPIDVQRWPRKIRQRYKVYGPKQICILSAQLRLDCPNAFCQA